MTFFKYTLLLLTFIVYFPYLAFTQGVSIDLEIMQQQLTDISRVSINPLEENFMPVQVKIRAVNPEFPKTETGENFINGLVFPDKVVVRK